MWPRFFRGHYSFFIDSTICYVSKGSKNGFFRQQSRLSHWCLYCGNKGGAHYIEELYRKIMDVAQRCSGCQETDTECKFHCDNCFSEKMVYNLCSTSGYTDWHPLLRPCSQCLRENIVCTRLLPLVWSTDCDPKQKTFMNTMLADREKVPLPGPYSRLPPQHQVSAFRWILALDRHWRLSRKRKATLVIV